MAAVAVPSVLGYLDSAKVNTDNSNAKEIEAAILRLAANNKITLGDTPTSAASITEAVKLEIDMPAVQQTGYGFYYDPKTGRVKCVKTSEAASTLQAIPQ